MSERESDEAEQVQATQVVQASTGPRPVPDEPGERRRVSSETSRRAATCSDGPAVTDRLRRLPPSRAAWPATLQWAGPLGLPLPLRTSVVSCPGSPVCSRLFPLHLIPSGCVLEFIKRPEPPTLLQFYQIREASGTEGTCGSGLKD